MDAILECHERIRRFMDYVSRIVGVDEAPESELSELAQSVLRYFEEALPLHAMDEDFSLVPRLRGKSAELDASLALMQQGHLSHGPILFRVLSLVRNIADEPTRRSELREPLTAALLSLRAHFEEHLKLEEEVIFPAARKVLAETELQAIRAEMRLRRAPRPTL